MSRGPLGLGFLLEKGVSPSNQLQIVRLENPKVLLAAALLPPVLTKLSTHALKDAVHFLENGIVYVLFYEYILELNKKCETHVKVGFISLGD